MFFQIKPWVSFLNQTWIIAIQLKTAITPQGLIEKIPYIVNIQKNNRYRDNVKDYHDLADF